MGTVEKRKMADEVLYELLHMEIVSQIHAAADKNEKVNCVSKLESMGFRVSQSMIERFTKDCPRFKDELDTMKFICKDFWSAVFKKQVDNLRTNHQGVYVLQDNRFRMLTQLSAGKQYIDAAHRHLAFSCGLIRGALANLGVASLVTVEVAQMPACKFQIQIQRL